jgi:ketosteroid isomerase-like protein
LYIVACPGLASRRWLPLSSNVRRRRTTLSTRMHLKTLIPCCLLALSLASVAQVTKQVGRYDTSPADVQAIERVTEDFRAAVIAKDAKRLSGLLINSYILFTSPSSPAWVRKRRQETNIHSDGIGSNGAANFLDFIATSKVPLEERFYNIKITQDGHLAWVVFDFEFLEDGKVDNFGLEVWQLVKTPDQGWKIFSVVWSSHGNAQ